MRPGTDSHWHGQLVRAVFASRSDADGVALPAKPGSLSGLAPPHYVFSTAFMNSVTVAATVSAMPWAVTIGLGADGGRQLLAYGVQDPHGEGLVG
jgi:hypothetical protein